MNCAGCSRSFPARAKAVIVDGKAYHPRCDKRPEKRQVEKRARVTQERTTRRARKALDVNAVFARDHGVCAICKLDTTRILPWIQSLPHAYQLGRPLAACGRSDRFASAVANGTILGRHRCRALVLLGRLWGVALSHGTHFSEIDHIVPIAEGGGDELSNLRTLCRKCHTRETADLKARLARRPTKAVGRGF